MTDLWLTEGAKAAHAVGIAGFGLMFAALVYSLRKRKVLVRVGAMKRWLTWHHWAGFIGGVLALVHTLGNLDGFGPVLVAILLVVLGSSGLYFLEGNSRRPLLEATTRLSEDRRERARLDREYRELYAGGMAATPQGAELYNRLMAQHKRVQGAEAEVARLQGRKSPWAWWSQLHVVSTLVLFGVVLVHIWSKLFFAWGGLG